ncbi:MAG: M18 family aminopeptidase [Clostridiales bacterium]|jgi:aspartyl aminopeptidase|nr:M18 family aminopeptidase [Clostridiales bacterium]
MRENAKKLLDFIYESPTAFHAAANVAAQLEGAGFSELFEGDDWDLKSGGKYFVRKNSSSIAAFVVGARAKLRAIAAHTDSPAFAIKPNPEIEAGGHIKLNTAAYGGIILHTWFDRPLAIAGRVLLKGENFLAPEEKLININRPLVIIPSLAIHLNREVNNGFKINPQVDTLPLAALENFSLADLLAKELERSSAQILDYDLMLYEYAPGVLLGENEEFISSPRLDDLWMVYGGLQAIKEAEAGEFTKLVYFPDNEEIGSLTAHGAQSRFIESVLRRINGGCEQSFAKMLADSFVISADLGHGSNPNYPEKDDPTTKTKLGGGPVLKYSPAQKYATTGYTAAIFKALCEKADVPCQGYIVRSDVQGGSTIGAMMSANLGVNVVDMGLAVLGMHSVRELGAVADNEYMLKLFKTFFEN